MKIGIDASRAFLKERTGTEEYAYQLIKNLTKIDLAFCQFFLYVREGSEVNMDLAQNFSIKRIKGGKLWTQLRLSWELLMHPVDLLFVPSHSVPFVHPRKTVVTIHGLEFKVCPECYSSGARKILDINTFLSILFARKIIVPSESTKKDLMRFYHVKPEKIKVVNHGIEYKTRNISANSEGGACRAKIRKNIFYILFIGRLEKRKNIVNLIKAFNRLKERTNKDKEDFKLILAGKAGYGFDEIKKEIENSEHKNDIVLTGYVSEEKKEGLYEEADLFVFPSFSEGFGMPVLEAMSYGVPVICSNTSSLPEISGDSVLMVDPYSVENMAEALEKISGDDINRESMVNKGFENIKRFSWKKCAKETMEVIMKV